MPVPCYTMYGYNSIFNFIRVLSRTNNKLIAKISLVFRAAISPGLRITDLRVK